MKKQLIIGLDLSLNSTGITASYLEDFECKKIEFYRLVFEKNSRHITNVNQETYNLPSNINTNDLLIFDADADSDGTVSDITNMEQASVTIKAMICAKRIGKIIERLLLKYDPDCVYFEIENFIMPSIAGKNQMIILGGLIMLQGFVRSTIIRYKLDQTKTYDSYTLFVTSPTELKKFFTNNGRADKDLMEQSFYANYEGMKLLPDDKGKIDDVIDSFALMVHCYSKIVKTKI